MYVLTCCKVVDTVDVAVSCAVDTYHVALLSVVMVFPRWAFQPVTMVGSDHIKTMSIGTNRHAIVWINTDHMV